MANAVSLSAGGIAMGWFKRAAGWQRFWLLAMFLFGCTFTAPDHWRPYFAWPACVIVLGYVLKWILYDGIKNAWNKYNEEQEEIVQIIKDSK